LKIESEDLDFLNKNLPEAYCSNRLIDKYRQSVPAIFIYQGKNIK